MSLTAGPRREVHRWVVATSAMVATVGLAAACWVVAIQRMEGMDMGVATQLGTFPFFLSVWVPMMAAMMLPGTAPAAWRLVQPGRRVLDVLWYVGTYLTVWALVGLVVFALYRPHGTLVAGACTVAAGVYELTPIKGRFRLRCRHRSFTGLELGWCCLGSTVGLMLMMVTVGVMSVTWMVVVAGIVTMQKLVAPRAAVDVAVALALVAFGIVIVVTPSSVPGLVHVM